jgi:drug/metabolite transporter (DMT)-like permease
VIAAWGSSYLFIRMAVESFTPWGLVATRFGLAAVLCFAFARGRREIFPSRNHGLRFALSGILITGRTIVGTILALLGVIWVKWVAIRATKVLEIRDEALAGAKSV